jgi:hypothetical protein
MGVIGGGTESYGDFFEEVRGWATCKMLGYIKWGEGKSLWVKNEVRLPFGDSLTLL